MYRAKITSASTPAANDASSPNTMQTYQLTASSFLTSSGGPSNSSASIQTLLKVTDTFRDRVSKLIYAESTKSLKFTLYPVEETSPGVIDLSQQSIFLYQVGSINYANSVYSITGKTNLLSSNLVNDFCYSGKKLTISTAPLNIGYYVFVATYTKPNVNYVQITYQSDRYACPFNSNYPDYYSNFQPCSGSISDKKEPGLPCLNYNPATFKCVDCIQGYVLVNDTCQVNT